nr:myb-like protein AA [Dermatophagoides farinae]
MNSNIDNNNGSNNGLPIDRQQQQQQQQQQPPYSYQQNQFQSSISCGQLEFYVQLTFDKPFKGLVYAYKMFKIEQNPMITNQQQQQIYGHYYYPIEILDSCTIRGNGASIVYLELSFLSECIEKLQPFSMMNTNFADNIEDYGNNNNKSNFNDTMMMNENNDGFINTHTINLDGFNFRRALNNNDMMQMNSFYLQQQQQQQQQYYHHHYHHQQQEQRQQQQQQQHQLNISKDDTYQLSLYIQNDPKIEQKYDSKVIVQCSPRVTKNIIMEHNSNLNDFYRKMDDNNIGDHNHHHHHHHHHHMMNNEIDITNLIESRMDILRGRIPFLKLIDNNVELGDDVTLIIRTRQLDDYDSRISTCYAYDEHDTMRYELTNQDGCPVDSTVMTAFKVMHNVGSESKVYYTTFPAFKFPGSQYLNIQCTLLVCRQICPNPTCDHNQHSNRNTQQW